MTFLRKRSRSQCSASSCDDDYTSHGKGSAEIRKHSGMSSNTQVTAEDFDLHDSCVLRQFPKHKSAHVRFLAWIQYTRQFPDNSITDEERRTCPLLWCRLSFQDQNAMLKHVWNCEHLVKGLYWCSQCQKPERIGKFQCRRCQGGSSKTYRIAIVARRIFSALGAKSAMEKPAPSMKEQRLALSDVSKGSGGVGSWNIMGATSDLHHSSYWDPPYIPELPNNYVSEMENTYIVPEMSSGGDKWPQRDSGASLFGKQKQTKPVIRAATQKQTTGSPYENWGFTHFGSPVGRESPRPTHSLLPRLDTKTQPDIQTAMPKQEPSTRFAGNPLSSTIVSPLSATGGFDFGVLDALDVSPTDSEASGQSLFTDSGYSSATFETSWNASDLDFRISRDFKKSRDNFLPRLSSNEFVENKSTFDKYPSIFPQIGEATQVNTMISFSDTTVSHSAGRCNAQDESQTLSPHWSTPQGLANSFLDVLDEHLQHSRAALKQMASNTITQELLSLSSSTIISIGFGVLESLLEGRTPSAIVPLFAFTHLAYALAIAVDHNSSVVHTQEWFHDSLSLLECLASEKQRQRYTQIVRVIWQPRVSSTFTDLGFAGLFNSSQPHENNLIRACKHFLDVIESLSYHENAPKSTLPLTQFNFAQASFVKRVKARKIIDELIQKTSIEAFIEDVIRVEKRLENGLITELRQLELELICAGKLASQSDNTFERFRDHVNHLCDSLRGDDTSPTSRNTHHLNTIALIQHMIPAEDHNDGEDKIGFDLNSDLDLNLPNPGYSTLDIGCGEIQDLIDMFTQEPECAESSLQPSGAFRYPIEQEATEVCRSKIGLLGERGNFSSNSGGTYPILMSFEMEELSRNVPPLTGPTIPLPAEMASSIALPPNVSHPIQSNKYRCHCGYEPTGSDEWKASNFARHKRTQHATANVYRCQYPSCSAKYRRSDNLRAHLRVKGHGDEEIMLRGVEANEDEDGEGDNDRDWEEPEMTIRSTKRRRKGDRGNETEHGMGTQ